MARFNEPVFWAGPRQIIDDGNGIGKEDSRTRGVTQSGG